MRSAPLKILQKLLQPDDRFEIEMVGGFVHQQDVGPAEQHAGQCHAHFPAAGKRPDIAIDLIVFEAEAMQHFAGLRFERVAAQMLVLFLHVAEARENAYPFHPTRAGSSRACCRASSS